MARPEPIDDVALLTEVAALRERSMGEASPGIPVQSGSRALLVAGVVAASVASFAAGFGGGFVVGQRSRPSTESMDVSRHESVAEPQPTRAAVEDPKPIASTTQTVAPISEEQVSSSEPIASPPPSAWHLNARYLPSSPAVFSFARRRPAPAWWLTANRVVSRRSPFASSPSGRIRLRSRTQVTTRGSSG